MHCCHCFTELNEPTPHEAFSSKAQQCPHCKTMNPVGIEEREAMILGLFNKVAALADQVDVLVAISPPTAPVPNRPMPAGPMTLKRKTR